MAEDAKEPAKTEYTAEESKARYIDVMGTELGTQFAALWQEIVALHLKWAEYVELFGTKPTRIELLNRAAPRYFRMLQDTLWEDALLHIARTTDAPQSGKDKPNLTIRNLPELTRDETLRTTLSALVAAAQKETEFCRDWRNRHIAHRDLNLATSHEAEPLAEASRKLVKDALRSLSDVLNAIETHYLKSKTCFNVEAGSGGAISLLHVLDDGLRAADDWLERLARGDPAIEDLRAREL